MYSLSLTDTFNTFLINSNKKINQTDPKLLNGSVNIKLQLC